MTLGTGSIVDLATSFRRTYPPLGVSISRFPMSLYVSRVSGVLQTWTSYALPSLEDVADFFARDQSGRRPGGRRPA